MVAKTYANKMTTDDNKCYEDSSRVGWGESPLEMAHSGKTSRTR